MLAPKEFITKGFLPLAKINKFPSVANFGASLAQLTIFHLIVLSIFSNYQMT